MDPLDLDALLSQPNEAEGCRCIVADFTVTTDIRTGDTVGAVTVAGLIDAILAKRDAGGPISTITAQSVIKQAFGLRISESTLNRHARICLGRRSWAKP